MTASSGPSTGSDTFTVLGANALGFGYNSWYEMGDGGAPGGDDRGTGALRTSPSQFLRVFPAPVTQVVSCGSGNDGGASQTTLVLLKDGTVWSVGGNGYAQLGTAGNSRSSWAQIPGLSNVIQLTASNAFVLALLADGTVKGWGDNTFNQLGTAVTAGSTTTPTIIAGLSGVKQVATSEATGYALLSDGSVKSWGALGSGRAGEGSVSGNSATMRQVSGLTSGVSAIAGFGRAGGFALMSDGSVKAWGAGSKGQMGDGLGTGTNATPVNVSGLSGATQIVGSYQSGYALLTTGKVKAWGLNDAGQLGDGTTSDRLAPVEVAGLTNVVKIAASGHSAYALLSDGSVRGWGDNQYGQLGDGSTTSRLTPVSVGIRANGTRAWGSQTAIDLTQYSYSSSRMYIITQ